MWYNILIEKREKGMLMGLILFLIGLAVLFSVVSTVIAFFAPEVGVVIGIALIIIWSIITLCFGVGIMSGTIIWSFF